MKPIAIFYHSLFYLGNPPELKPNAVNIVGEQMSTLKSSGLEEAANEIHIGVNGGIESESKAMEMFPAKSGIVYHGLESRAENLTLVMIEKWVKEHPGWVVFYFHCKGATHAQGSDYELFSARWRRCMMKHGVTNWQAAVSELETHDAVGCHWLTGMGSDQSQHFFAGNFWWATSDFLATLPSIYERARIKESGIASLESRYEAEVWIGNGRMPKIKDLETTHGLAQCP